MNLAGAIKSRVRATRWDGPGAGAGAGRAGRGMHRLPLPRRQLEPVLREDARSGEAASPVAQRARRAQQGARLLLLGADAGHHREDGDSQRVSGARLQMIAPLQTTPSAS